MSAPQPADGDGSPQSADSCGRLRSKTTPKARSNGKTPTGSGSSQGGHYPFIAAEQAHHAAARATVPVVEVQSGGAVQEAAAPGRPGQPAMNPPPPPPPNPPADEIHEEPLPPYAPPAAPLPGVEAPVSQAQVAALTQEMRNLTRVVERVDQGVGEVRQEMKQDMASLKARVERLERERQQG